MDKVAFLKGTRLFQGLEPDELRYLVSVLKVTRFEPGEAVFVEGDESDAAYIVIEGEVRLTKRIAPDVERQVATVGPGGIFGEMGMLERGFRSASAICDAEVFCLFIDANLFETIATDHAPICAKMGAELARILSRRLRTTTNLYADAIRWALDISGAKRLAFADLIGSGELQFQLRNGARMAGRLVRVDRETRDLTIESRSGALVLLPYHAIDSVHLGGTLNPEPARDAPDTQDAEAV